MKLRLFGTDERPLLDLTIWSLFFEEDIWLAELLPNPFEDLLDPGGGGNGGGIVYCAGGSG